MKITPVAQGQGVPTNTQTPAPNRIERAKAIASGQEPPAVNAQEEVEKAKNALQKIQMKTQVSTNRDDAAVIDDLVESPVPQGTENNPMADNNEQAEVVEDTKPLSPQFAALAKQKRALQVKERELAQREAELKTKSEGNNANLTDYVSKADLKANPLKIFEAGITYDDLTQAILNNGGATPSIDPAKLRAELKEELKTELLGEFSNRDTQQEKQVLSQMRRDVDALTVAGEDFEAIRAANAQQDVVDLIHRTYKDSGEMLDVSDAAKLVEEQLIEEALPFAKIKKVQSRLTPAQEAALEQQIAPVQQPQRTMRTLTNRDSARPSVDRRQRAIAAFNGSLRKG